MKKAGIKVLRNEEWQIEDDLVLKEVEIGDYSASSQYANSRT